MSTAFGSGLTRLTEELSAVREAWHKEGVELRGRLNNIHDAKLRADEAHLRTQAEVRHNACIHYYC